jgi:TonB family protein
MRKPILLKSAVALLTAAVLVCAVAPLAWAGGRKVRRRVAPAYPELAKRMNVRGIVYVETKVAPDGSVTEAHVTRGNHLLAPAAEAAVKKWKFAPEAHPSSEKVVVEFTLTNRSISQEDAGQMAAAWLPIPR